MIRSLRVRFFLLVWPLVVVSLVLLGTLLGRWSQVELRRVSSELRSELRIGQALDWMVLMREEIGPDFLVPSLFRFGASTLLADIERQLEHHVTGRYSAYNRHPVG